MAATQRRPYAEPQRMNDAESGLYEVVATFEFQGRPMTEEAISTAAGLDPEAAADLLQRLTERDVLVRTEEGGRPAYALARRDWSAAPGLRRHFPPGHFAEEQEPTGQMPRPAREAGPAGHAEPARKAGPQPPEATASDAGAPLPGPANGRRAREAGEDREDRPAAPDAPQQVMTGPSPQGRVRDAPGTLIAQAGRSGERPEQARLVANAVPGKPDGEVDTRL